MNNLNAALQVSRAFEIFSEALDPTEQREVLEAALKSDRIAFGHLLTMMSTMLPEARTVRENVISECLMVLRRVETYLDQEAKLQEPPQTADGLLAEVREAIQGVVKR